jgi:hypothetical protein
MTLARFFLRLRNDARMSQRDVGRASRPRLDATAVWKIENGRPVRAATLAQALRAVGLKEADADYVQAFALWSTEQAGTLPLATVDRGIDRVRTANGRAFNDALNRAAAALQAMPETDWPIALAALEQPAALKLLFQAASAMPAPTAKK